MAALAPGSECVLTFGGHRRPAASGVPSLAGVVAAAGEPFRSALDLSELGELCRVTGLGSPVVPADSEIVAFLGDRHDGLHPPARHSIASVMVADCHSDRYSLGTT